MTGTGIIVGTPGYMAPEVTLKGITNDPRSDLYALGVIWFEMLVGRAPFDAPTPVMLVMKHATEPVPWPSSLVATPGVAGDVEALALRLLAKDPSERPQTAAELLRLVDDLRDAVRSKGPLGVAPPPAKYLTSLPANAPTISTMSVPNPVAASPATVAPPPSSSRLPLLAAGVVVAIALVVVAVALLQPKAAPGREEACVDGDAAACVFVAEQANLRGERDRSTAAWESACRVGSTQGCERLAVVVAEDPSSLGSTRRALACSKGVASACVNKAAERALPVVDVAALVPPRVAPPVGLFRASGRVSLPSE